MRISDWSSDVCSSDLLLNSARTRAQIHDNTVTAAGSLFDLFSKTDLSSYSGLHDVLQKLRDSAVAEGNKAEELTAQLADIDPQHIIDQIGRAHVCTPVPNAQLQCRLLLDKHKH